MNLYGATWPERPSDQTPDEYRLEIEFACIRQGGRWLDEEGYVCGAGLYQHYLNVWKMLWPEDDHHRWIDLALRRICENDIAVFMGPGDSSKTWAISKFVMADWWADPMRTLWMVSTTDRRGAELRIWGAVKSFFNSAKARFPSLPGFCLESKGCITPDQISDDGTTARLLTRGIILIPCKQGTTWLGLGCFPAGEHVDTPEGQKPIEQIKEGDKILGAGGPAKVKRCSVRPAPVLIRVHLDNGRHFDCTPEHRILTEHGWVEAVDIPPQTKLASVHDSLRVLPEGITGKELSDAFLLRSLSKAKLAQAVCELRPRIPALRAEGNLLQSIMCGGVEVEATGDCTEIPSESTGPGKAECDSQPSDHGRPGGKATAQRENEGSEWSINPEWERAEWEILFRDGYPHFRRIKAPRIIPGCGCTIQGSDPEKLKAWRRALLQARLRLAGHSIECGTGWKISPHRRSAAEGHEPGSIHAGPRVAGIEILEQAGDPRYSKSDGAYPVYNLEIDGHPSYSVSGVLVHNSYAGIKPPSHGRMGHAGDEASLMMPSFLDAYANWYGKKNFRGLLTGNPGDLEDPLCTAGEPVEGWDQWRDSGLTQEWRSRWYNAWVVAFDGRDTPNNDFPYLNGKPRYHYLIGKKKIDAVKSHYGEHDWHFWNQCVGKPQTSVQARRVITRQQCRNHRAYDDVIWQSVDKLTKVAALDAAYGGVGGDRCVIMEGVFGTDVDGHMVLAVSPPAIVPVSVKNQEEPEIQIARFCKDWCAARGIPPENFFFDGRGTLALRMAQEWNNLVNVVDFGGPATARPVSNDSFIWEGETMTKRLRLCNEEYFNFVTELWFAVSQLVISEQMRRLPEEVAQEGFRRTWNMKGNKKQVEPKQEMKERTKESPDLFDTLVTLVEGARRLGFIIEKMKGGEDAGDRDADRWLEKELANRRQFLRKTSMSYA